MLDSSKITELVSTAKNFGFTFFLNKIPKVLVSSKIFIVLSLKTSAEISISITLGNFHDVIFLGKNRIHFKNIARLYQFIVSLKNSLSFTSILCLMKNEISSLWQYLMWAHYDFNHFLCFFPPFSPSIFPFYDLFV